MRYGRAKAARKTLQFYARTIGIKAPYEILLDGTFLVAMVKAKLPLRERLDKLLQHTPFVLNIARASVEELDSLHAASSKEETKILLSKAREWINFECDNIVDEIPETDLKDKAFASLSKAGQDTVRLVTDGATKYFIASQDESILDMLRHLGSVPCVRLARGSVLLLESPSKAGLGQDRQQERLKWKGSKHLQEKESELVSLVKEKDREERQEKRKMEQGRDTTRRRKQKAREPNPLSCKKRKQSETEATTKKRRRKRNQSSNEITQTAVETD